MSGTDQCHITSSPIVLRPGSDAMSGTDIGYAPTLALCEVRMLLHIRYAMSSTDIGYTSTICVVESGTDAGYDATRWVVKFDEALEDWFNTGRCAIGLRECYAMSGTDVA
eukprot:1131563-Rhodomonas_salina.2